MVGFHPTDPGSSPGMGIIPIGYGKPSPIGYGNNPPQLVIQQLLLIIIQNNK